MGLPRKAREVGSLKNNPKQRNPSKPRKAVWFSPPMKKLIMKYKLRTELESGSADFMEKMTYARIVMDSSWQNDLLRYIQTRLPHTPVKDTDLRSWIEFHPWILEYKGSPKAKGDIKMLQKLKDDMKNSAPKDNQPSLPVQEVESEDDDDDDLFMEVWIKRSPTSTAPPFVVKTEAPEVPLDSEQPDQSNTNTEEEETRTAPTLDQEIESTNRDLSLEQNQNPSSQDLPAQVIGAVENFFANQPQQEQQGDYAVFDGILTVYNNNNNSNSTLPNPAGQNAPPDQNSLFEVLITAFGSIGNPQASGEIPTAPVETPPDSISAIPSTSAPKPVQVVQPDVQTPAVPVNIEPKHKRASTSRSIDESKPNLEELHRFAKRIKPEGASLESILNLVPHLQKINSVFTQESKLQPHLHLVREVYKKLNELQGELVMSDSNPEVNSKKVETRGVKTERVEVIDISGED